VIDSNTVSLGRQQYRGARVYHRDSPAARCWNRY